MDPRAAIIDRVIRLWTRLLLPGDPPRFSFARMFLIGGVILVLALITGR
jgi:hypothetical protein